MLGYESSKAVTVMQFHTLLLYLTLGPVVYCQQISKFLKKKVLLHGHFVKPVFFPSCFLFAHHLHNLVVWSLNILFKARVLEKGSQCFAETEHWKLRSHLKLNTSYL